MLQNSDHKGFRDAIRAHYSESKVMVKGGYHLIYCGDKGRIAGIRHIVANEVREYAYPTEGEMMNHVRAYNYQITRDEMTVAGSFLLVAAREDNMYFSTEIVSPYLHVSEIFAIDNFAEELLVFDLIDGTAQKGEIVVYEDIHDGSVDSTPTDMFNPEEARNVLARFKYEIAA